MHVAHSKSKIRLYFYYQPSTEQLSTKLNSLRMTNNLDDFYIP